MFSIRKTNKYNIFYIIFYTEGNNFTYLTTD